MQVMCNSVNYALQRLDISATVTDDADEILSADKVIFPGVGDAAPAMKYLKEKNLDALIKNIKQPFLAFVLACNYSVIIQKKVIQNVWVFLIECKKVYRQRKNSANGLE